jgi:hypothetical protein
VYHVGFVSASIVDRFVGFFLALVLDETKKSGNGSNHHRHCLSAVFLIQMLGLPSL